MDRLKFNWLIYLFFLLIFISSIVFLTQLYLFADLNQIQYSTSQGVREVLLLGIGTSAVLILVFYDLLIRSALNKSFVIKIITGFFKPTEHPKENDPFILEKHVESKIQKTGEKLIGYVIMLGFATTFLVFFAGDYSQYVSQISTGLWILMFILIFFTQKPGDFLKNVN